MQATNTSSTWSIRIPVSSSVSRRTPLLELRGELVRPVPQPACLWQGHSRIQAGGIAASTQSPLWKGSTIGQQHCHHVCKLREKVSATIHRGEDNRRCTFEEHTDLQRWSSSRELEYIPAYFDA